MNYAMLFPGNVVQAVQLGGDRPEAPDDVEVVETSALPTPGQLHKGGDKFEDPPPDDPLPALMPALSRVQFATGLWGDGLIDFAQCRAFIAGTDVPQPLLELLSDLADDDDGGPTPRKEAELLLLGARDFVFSHPLVEPIREAKGWSAEHLRGRWAVWAGG